MIVWNNIKKLFIHHRLMAFLFLLVLFVTDISVFYALNFYHQITDMQSFYDDEARSYSIAYEGEELADRLDGFCADFSKPLKRIYVQLQHHTDRILANYLGESSARIKVFFGRYFHESSIDEILTPRTGKYQIGDDYFLEGKPLKIIGINAEDVFEIPFANIPAHTPLTVTFVTENPLTQKELQQLQTCVSASFGVSTLKLPDGQSANQNILIECIVLVGIVLLTLLNVAYLYSCLLDKRKRQCRIFRVLGCGPVKCGLLYLAELWILSTLLYGLAVLIFEAGILKIMNGISAFYVHALTAETYGGIYVLMLILVTLLNLLNLKGILKA